MDGKTGSEDIQKEAGTLQTMDPPSNIEVEKNVSGNTAGRQEGNSDQVSKRNISEVEGGEEGDEESKRKKRKDSGCNALGKCFGGRNGTNSGKCPKTHLDSKTGNKGSCSSSSTDRKSPSNASGPGGPSARKLGTENEGEEIRSTKSSISSSSDGNASSSAWAGGLKVPPLKIVIPQQSSSSEQDQGNRNGKAGAARHHQALPYVVTSTNSSEPITDKEIGSGGSVSSTDKGDLTGLGTDSHHQRVLRSSHRSGNGTATATNGSGSGIQTPVSSSGNTVSTQPSSSSVAAESLPSTAAVSDTGSNNSSPPPNNSQHPSSSSTETVVPVSEPSTATPTASTEEKTNESPEQESQQQQSQQQQIQQQQPPQSPPLPPPPPPPPQQPPQPSPQPSQQSQQQTPTHTVQVHPRKRKIKQNKESSVTSTTPTPAPATEVPETSGSTSEPQPPELSIPNSYQSFRNIRKQVDRRRKGLFPVQPKPPQGFKDYLMNRCTYLLAGNAANCISVSMASPPPNLQLPIKNLFIEQEKERRKLQMQHIVEKEKLVLAVEQEILRVHGRAARALANQSLPFSVCTILKDEEIYNEITPEQEEKDRNARSRYNGRLFLSWLQDVDDKWEKIKEGMLNRHHAEAASLRGIQCMDWEWKMKELGLCEQKASPVIDETLVPLVHVSDDFNLLPT